MSYAMYCVCYRLPVAERRGYTSAFNALFRISREEGVLTLWRVGITPAVICTLIELSFAHIMVIAKKDRILLSLSPPVPASLSSSFCLLHPFTIPPLFSLPLSFPLSPHTQGCGPTMVRAMVVNAAQLGTYFQAKQFLLGLGKETL